MKNKGQANRNTIQRDMVFSAVTSLNHPTAEEVYGQVASAYPGISKTTVYRNLNLLAEMGDILKINSPVGADHFDYNVRPHFHALCYKCGRVCDIEITSEFLKCLENCVKDAHEFQIDSREVIFKGICPYCIKKS